MFAANVQLVGAGLGETFDRYKCNASICYGTDGGSTHALFKEFQYQLNRAGKALASGWKSISVDGFIGSDTLRGYNALAAATTASGGIYRGLPFASSFVDLSGKIRTTDLVVYVAEIANQASGKSESPSDIEARAAAAIREGQATTVATPVRYDGTPVTVAKRPGIAMAVGITAGLAAVGLVGVAILQRRKRRRR